MKEKEKEERRVKEKEKEERRERENVSFSSTTKEKKTKKTKSLSLLPHLDPARVVQVRRDGDQRLHVRGVRHDTPDGHQRPDVRGADRPQRQRFLRLARHRGSQQHVVAPEQVRGEAVLRIRDESRSSGASLGLGAGLALLRVCGGGREEGRERKEG